MPSSAMAMARVYAFGDGGRRGAVASNRARRRRPLPGAQPGKPSIASGSISSAGANPNTVP